MLSRIYKSAFVAMILISCSQGASTPQISQEDKLNTAVASIIQTQTAVAATLSPIQIPLSETPEQSTTKEFAWNYLATQDIGGIEITIGRVVIGERIYIPLDFSNIPILNDRPVLVEIIFIIENKTTNTASVYPDQGTTRIGGEQTELQDYAISGGNLEGGVYSGDVLPGTKLIGGLWFGLDKTALTEINSMTVFIAAPLDQNFNTLGPDYIFNLDLSLKQFSELPQELKGFTFR